MMPMTGPGFFAPARGRHGDGSVGSRLETCSIGLAVCRRSGTVLPCFYAGEFSKL